MALDSALYTLHFVRRERHPWIVDLYQANQQSTFAQQAPPVPTKEVDPDDNKPKAFSGTIPDKPTRQNSNIDYSKLTPIYTRQRATNSARYSSILLDGLLPDCLLVSVTAPSTAPRIKTIQLHNPDANVVLEKKGMTFRQDWFFSFANELFRWRREASTRAYTCQALRKPDPNVITAHYRPSTKSKPAMMQLMDYNIDRLGIEDKRGLELVLVMALSTLLDQDYDEKLAQSGEQNIHISKEALDESGSPSSHALAAPVPEAASSAATTTALEPNEVLITPWGTQEEYVQHCIDLLRTDRGKCMYMIVLKSDSVETTAKAIQVAARVKAAYYRLPDEAKGTVYGQASGKREIEDELYQYVQAEDEAKGSPASKDDAPKRKVIMLDPPTASSSRPTTPASSLKPNTAYVPPSKLKVILSKERIGELEPPKQPATTSSSHPPFLTVAKPALPKRPPSRDHGEPPKDPTPPAEQGKEGTGGRGKGLLSKLGLAG